MPGEGEIGKSQMAATYQVEITGIERTRNELKKLTGAIQQLRAGNYSPGHSMTRLSGIGSSDILLTKLDAMEGRIQTAAGKAMIAAMDKGKDVQEIALQAAVTPTGLSGRSHVKGGTRNGPGRDDTGAMIRALKRSVEVLKHAGETVITGWHGWGLNDEGGRESYLGYQEKGTVHIGAANSLGHAVPIVREFLKEELGKLKR